MGLLTMHSVLSGIFVLMSLLCLGAICRTQRDKLLLRIELSLVVLAWVAGEILWTFQFISPTKYLFVHQMYLKPHRTAQLNVLSWNFYSLLARELKLLLSLRSLLLSSFCLMYAYFVKYLNLFQRAVSNKVELFVCVSVCPGFLCF